jgi:acetyl-CoA carboxylase biotin carboxylase subunit
VTLRRCLIANRGEIAVRLIRACREGGIEAVAVYSDADAGALHVRLADRAVHLGGSAPADSYLHIGRLIDAARQTACDCVHPGYGFMSESAAFAAAVIDAGLIWIGPRPDAIAAMGDKLDARRRMIAAGVPVAPGGEIPPGGALPSDLTYPVMVKAAGGGGGRGIRIVHTPDDLAEAVESAQREAEHAFGDGRVFVERYIAPGRHIEVQILADAHGAVIHLGERECSAQRRHQKVIEESPSPLIDMAARARIGAAAVEAARAVGYVSAGTVEFIADGAGNFYFLEMNTRLQVEHPVTECATGLDIVQAQFRIAAGEPLRLTQDDVHLRGHAIEARLYAEDPDADFAPQPGRAAVFRPPVMPGVRVDAGIESGDAIPHQYDPLIAKIIAYDRTRDGAIRRLDMALRETVILGVTTNRDFLRRLIRHEAFAAGEIDTGFIERSMDALIADQVDPETLDRALIAAAFASMGGAARAKSDARRAESPWERADGFRL